MGLPFLSSQAKKREHIVAIDLGGRNTKAVHVQRRGGAFALLNYVVVEAPVGEKGVSREMLAEHLRVVTRSMNLGKVRQVTLAVGVADAVFRQVELPIMPVADMRQMLKFNTKNYLQQDLPDHVFDCFISPNLSAPKPAEAGKAAGGQPKHKVMVGAARRPFVEEIEGAAKDAGLVADQLVPGIIGPCNAFEAADPDAFAKDVVALVEVGFKHTTITILSAGEIALNRVVTIGGDRITTGLAEALGVSYGEAENIKIGMPTEVEDSLGPLIHPLGRELRASIDFYEHQADKAVGQIYVSGGAARSEFILQALQAELMVPCKAWNPVGGLQLALPPEKMGEIEEIAPQLTVAFGAAATAF